MLVFQTRGRRPLFDAGPCRFWDGDGGGAAGGDGGSGGATPPAGGNPPANPDDGLGEAGKEAIRKEREAAKAARDELAAAKRELEELRNAGASDAEKALKSARDETAKAVRGEFESKLRRVEVRSALRVSGITNDKDLELAVNAPEFASLAVDDDGGVKDLAAAVAQFKKDHPSLFAPAHAGGGSVTRGPSGSSTDNRPRTLADAVAASLAPK